MARSHLLSFAACVTMLLVVVGVPCYAADGGPVGIIADYQPVKARLLIYRIGQTKPLALTIGTQIHVDDVVDQLPPDSHVLVADATGATTRIQGPGKRLRLAPADASALGIFGRMLGSLQNYFGEPYRASRLAASQGGDDCAGAGDIEVPLLPDGSAIVAGTRDLRFAWKGGCAPFTVVVSDARGRELARQTAGTRAARFREIALPAGNARIAISSAAQRKQIRLEFVAALPKFPAELAAESGALEPLARALWLAERDGGRWKFESFDLLAPMIRAKDPLAGRFGDVLLWGVGGAPP